MNEPEELSDYWKALIDDYLDGLLDEAGMQNLEGHLRADRSARDYFVRYAQLHTDLCLEARARDAASRALERLQWLTREEFTPPEILRTNLASVILQMKSLRLGEIQDFPFIEPPDFVMY